MARVVARDNVWLPHKRSSVPRLILEAFRDRIAAGQYVPGARLPTIADLSAEFGVARSSIREAMRALEMIGLVEIRHGDGIYVASGQSDFIGVPLTWGLLLTEQTQQELVQVRFILEIAAAELAACNAGSADYLAMQGAIADLRIADEPTAAAMADLDFHLAVTRASGNRILDRWLRAIRDLLRPIFVIALRHDGVQRRVFEYHQSVLDAIVSQSPEKAGLAMKEHLSFVAGIWLGTVATTAGTESDHAGETVR